MSAIAPFLESYQGTLADESFFSPECDGGRHLASSGGDLIGVDLAGRACETPLAVVGRKHANLVRDAWDRQLAWDHLAGQEIGVEAEGPDVFLTIERPWGEGPPWNRLPPSHRRLTRVRLLSWTSKMQCPSFSLPAGAPAIGGACPGAVAGQSVADPSSRGFVEVSRLVEHHTGHRAEAHAWLASAICQSCYATGGFYQRTSKVLAQAIVYEWTRRALLVPGTRASSLFVDVLVDAIGRADYGLEPERWRPFGRFFRVHDSGDFFSVAYLAAWKEIANAFLPGAGAGEVMFWAPTRMWAVPGFAEAINEINAPPGNLIIRPSAYHVNQPCPEAHALGPGFAAGTTVTHRQLLEELTQARRFDWNCRAYDSEVEAHTCRDAAAPDGLPGCRACWVQPEAVVNYKLH